MRKYLLPLLFLASIISVNAQKNLKYAEVITSGNETLKGNIEYLDWVYTPGSVKFTDSEGHVTDLTPHTIKEFYIPSVNERFISKSLFIDRTSKNDFDNRLQNRAKMIKDTVFLQVVLLGPVSLYYYNDNNKPHFFIEKGTEGVHELLYTGNMETTVNGVDNPAISPLAIENLIYNNNLKAINYFKGQLLYFLSEYPDAGKEIEKLKYSWSDLSEIVSNYNDYVAPGLQTFVSEGEPLLTEMRVMAGFSGSFLRISGTGIWNFNKGYIPVSIRPMAGVGIDVISNRNFQRWGLTTDLVYSELKTDAECYSSLNSINPERDTVFFDLSFLTMSAGARFKAETVKLKPFAKLGGLASLTLKREAVNTRPFEVLNWQFGFFTGGGIEVKGFDIEYRFNVTIDFSPYIYYKANIVSNYLMVTYTFGSRK